MRTIEQRINGLGLTEPTIQLHGRTDAEYEILVQLPGVDDPARVKQIMQTAAMLEITDVRDGPFASPEQAMAKNGGVLPLNSRVVKMAPGRESADSWYLVNRSASGHGAGSAQRAAGAGRVPEMGDEFHPDAGRCTAIRPVHGIQHRQPVGGDAGQPDPQRGEHPEPDRRFRPDHGHRWRAGGLGSGAGAAGGIPAGWHCLPGGDEPSVPRWAPIRSGRGSRPGWSDWRW